MKVSGDIKYIRPVDSPSAFRPLVIQSTRTRLASPIRMESLFLDETASGEGGDRVGDDGQEQARAQFCLKDVRNCEGKTSRCA